jgi:F-type H+-transporting ATPase subunit delta
MKDTRAALRYAKAILNLAKDSNDESKVNDDMLLVAKTITENKELNVMLHSPVIKAEDKRNVLNAIFEGKVNNITLGLFHLLEDNRRMDLLEIVAGKYTIIYDYLKSIDVAKVTTAVPLTKDIEKQVMDKVVSLTGNKATLENKVDPSIIGGFILRVGDVQYDASISNYLNELRKEFDHSDFIPKI